MGRAMAIDVDRVRRETPGVARVLHFNNAGAALPPACVVDRVVEHLHLEAAIGGYEAADEARDSINAAYESIARMLRCAPQEIALVDSATRAWAAAFYSMRFQPGDRIVTGRAEYASNVLALLQVASRTGAEIVVVPDDESGQFDVDALRRVIDERVKLVAMTHVPTNGGLVNPAAAVGAVTRAAGIPFLLDACQSAGQMPLDVDALGCDMLSATGRKYLRGPRATGFLYVRREWIERLEPAIVDLHSAEWTSHSGYQLRDDAKRFETWEGYAAGRIGLATAVQYALDLGLEEIWTRVRTLAGRLRAGLAEIPGVTVRDKGAVRCGLVTFECAGEPARKVQARLHRASINTSVSERSSTRYDMDARGIDSLVRASVHYYNTEAEIERFCAELADNR